jgi:pilus assembly protein Flp/PilA
MNLTILRALLADEDGATMVEYSLVLGLISMLCISALSFLGGKISHLFSTIGSSIASA